MNTTVVTPPVGSVCALDAAKAYLRVGQTAEDALVGELVAAATARVEAETGLALLTRTMKTSLTEWDGLIVRLRPAPVTALVSVNVIDADGVAQDVTGAFTLEPGRPAIACRKAGQAPVGVPAGGRLEIVFETGFGAAEDVPDDLVLAVKWLSAFLYDRGNAGNPGGLPESVRQLLAPWGEVRL